MAHPSIFNDVIGPVMRGPSSSHCAASVRIGRLVRDLAGGELARVLIEFDPAGSLATTHATQGSDMGLFTGMLGHDATDERMPEAERAIAEAGIEVDIRIVAYGASHPNTYRITAGGPSGTHRTTAISTGGGMIEVVEIDGVALSLAGDSFETLVWPREGDAGRAEALGETIAERAGAPAVEVLRGDGAALVRVRSLRPLEPDLVRELLADPAVREVRELRPVVPSLAAGPVEVPFLTCADMLQHNRSEELALWELGRRYESVRGSISEDRVFEEMRALVRVMRRSVETGLAGTEYADRVLGQQSDRFVEAAGRGALLDAGMLNRIAPYVTAIMETKSSMGVIVAAPTAGACATLPGACLGAADAMGLGEDDVVRALLAAGVIGVFISAHATFAAEVGGCQAETGAGAGMAAAGLVTLAGGSTAQAIAAGSMALQNTFGLVCDPVGNRVEVPCLGKNVMGAANAVMCANMALAGYDPVIPLDEVIVAMHQVGQSLPCELRCTALGGLAVTPTAKAIEARLAEPRS